MPIALAKPVFAITVKPKKRTCEFLGLWEN